MSDRGGLASCNGGGFVLPLPADLTVHSRIRWVGAVEPWMEVIAGSPSTNVLY